MVGIAYCYFYHISLIADDDLILAEKGPISKQRRGSEDLSCGIIIFMFINGIFDTGIHTKYR